MKKIIYILILLLATTEYSWGIGEIIEAKKVSVYHQVLQKPQRFSKKIWIKVVNDREWYVYENPELYGDPVTYYVSAYPKNDHWVSYYFSMSTPSFLSEPLIYNYETETLNGTFKISKDGSGRIQSIRARGVFAGFWYGYTRISGKTIN